MAIRNGFIGSVGNTPLVRLEKLSAETGCEILGKAEFLNPGGSVKDRAALYIIQDAERRGTLKPGGTVVEGTAGNTGIGLAHICAARGYRCVIVIPETQSQEKMDLLRVLGAEVRPVPAVPYKDPNNYQKIAGRLAQELDNAIWANQFDNLVNRQAHYETTGPEIWRDTGGRVDAFVCSTGTGGTLAGVARYLKEQNPAVRTVLADPHGSGLYSFVKTGTMHRDSIEAIEEMVSLGVELVHAHVPGASTSDGAAVIRRLKECCPVLIVGGGIRTPDEAKRVLDAGADAISIASAAMDDPGLCGRIQKGIGVGC